MKRNHKIERVELQPDYTISRVIKGGWHLAGGHGQVDVCQAIEDMRAFVEAGVTTFDCADIYTGVEELIGKFIRQNKSAFTSGDLAPLQIHTKYVPDHDALRSLTKSDTVAIIDRSLQRLGVERLDMVQFAWWNYDIPGYVEAALHLTELQKEGKIRYIGVTNFDATHLWELLDAGVPVVANQVQYSVLDRRPEKDMHALAKEFDIAYLCYGAVAGGFLSDRYLGAPDPQAPLENRSLIKYRLIIEELGNYDLFQRILKTLRKIADKHTVGIAEIATRYILQKTKVASVIIGARNLDHLDNLKKLGSFFLEDADLEEINQIVALGEGPKGPVFDLERDQKGKHGRIMKYNLSNYSPGVLL